MAYEKILVAYDGSDHAKRALGAALEMIDHTLANEVVVLSVMEPISGGDVTLEIAARMSNVISTSDVEEKHAELDEELKGIVAGHEDDVLTMVKLGKPGDAIVAVSKELGCDLIVMGSRGLGALRSLFGSVSTHVLHHAEIPVLITR